MSNNPFCIEKENHFIIRRWLIMCIASLAVAGLFSALLVSARTPFIQNLLPWASVFKTSLTIHVNLSVLVWFIAFGVVLSNSLTKNKCRTIDKLTFCAASFGVLLFVISPFIIDSEALLNNYVPILNNKFFITGIFIFLLSIAVKMILLLANYDRTSLRSNAITSSALIYIIAIITLLISYLQINGLNYNPHQFYETLFWGSGHILQLFYVQIMLIAWLWLANIGGFNLSNTKLYNTIFLINVVIAIISMLSMFIYPAGTAEHMNLFTQLMRYFGGLSPVILGLIITKFTLTNWHNSKQSPHHWSLLWSIFMFGFGGILALSIDGINTIIPAHYHGSIVGITLAAMGVIYHIIHNLGYPSMRKSLLTLQPFIYGIGQLMHISGLAWSGGYGALRKTPGAIESIEGQAAMGLMGLGGLLSVIGGLMFIIMCTKSLLNK